VTVLTDETVRKAALPQFERRKTAMQMGASEMPIEEDSPLARPSGRTAALLSAMARDQFADFTSLRSC